MSTIINNEDELAEWIEIIYLQNVNGRETDKELFRLGIESAIEELSDLKLIAFPVVIPP